MTAPVETSTSSEAAELLTVQEVCDRLRISRWTFYRLIQRQELRSVTIGRSRRVSEAAVRSYIDRLEARGDAA